MMIQSSAQQKLVKQMELREAESLARLQALSDSSTDQAQARQQAMTALEGALAELSQQLIEADQSRVQLEQKLESECGSSAVDIQQAQVMDLPTG